jgi:hypothetical protein
MSLKFPSQNQQLRMEDKDVNTSIEETKKPGEKLENTAEEKPQGVFECNICLDSATDPGINDRNIYFH